MLFHSFISLFLTFVTVLAAGLDDGTVSNVRSKMLAIIEQSWELGTATEALLELEEQDVSVYGDHPFPPSRTVSARSPVISLAERVVSSKEPGTLPLMADGAVGDPASMGVAVILANQTLNDDNYFQAASQQLDFLLHVAPRAPNAAISQRTDEVQLWDDFIYMAPPFIAYYGAITNDYNLLMEAKRQIGLYRDVLRDPNTKLWQHVLLGSWNDTSLWGTGNGWAVAGSARVLQTMLKSSYATAMVADMWELSGWISEILSAVWSYQDPDTGAVRNHPNNPSDFLDSSSTALYAATTYRLAVQTGDSSMIDNAERAFDYIATQIASDGTLQNVVNPGSWNTQASQSPEGQAFVLLLQAAWRDYNSWKDSGSAASLNNL